uniref:Uncharacterized protein n=1 Tax=Geospiza parvula TaxID=87175 RepID=A0A8U8AVL3_GEOPR
CCSGVYRPHEIDIIVCMCACVYTYTDTYIHTHIYIYIYLWMYVYIHMGCKGNPKPTGFGSFSCIWMLFIFTLFK